jgi:hypothetical protein
MAFQVSPGVNVSEVDLTTVVPATSTTEGAIAGVFRWGPINERILISNETDLIARFGRPYSASSQTVNVSGTAETITFGAFSLPTQDEDGTDTITLTVGTEAFTVQGTWETNTELANDLQAEIVNNGFTAFTVGVDVNDKITVTYASLGNKLNIAYKLEYTGGGDAVDDITPSIVDGSDTTFKNVSWSNIETFYSASDFLGYSDALYVVRVSDGAQARGTIGSQLEDVYAKYPGELGNSIRVVMISETDYAVEAAKYGSVASLFEFKPSTGNFHVAVIDATGDLSGQKDTVLEKFSDLSVAAGSKDDYGRSNYGPEVLQQRSNYITSTSAAQWLTTLDLDPVGLLSGGADGSDESAIDPGTLIDGYDLFANADDVEISFLIQGKARGTNDTTLANHLIDMATDRRDCVAVVSPGADIISDTNKIEFAQTFAANLTKSTYGICDTGYKYRYDKHNDRYVYTPLNADIAGLCARTDDTRDTWFSPAGSERGLIRNVVKLAWNPNKAERDNLYRAGINPVITQAGQGTLLFGDKTLSPRPSAFDRINVRRLFIVLEKAISRAAQTTLFEFNDEFTRAQFKNLVEPFLRDVQGRRGIYDFSVVCDETNNTPSVIDRNEFVGDIYIKPARSINYIQLNFIAVATGVEFTEVVAG